MRSFISIIAVLLAVCAQPASALNFGGDTDNSINNSAAASSSSKASSRAQAEAGAVSTSKGGDARSTSVSKGGSAHSGAISGGNVLKGGATNLNLQGDTVSYREAAQAGSVSNSVAYDCGGTAGGYISVPGGSIGGGSAFAFPLCEDIYTARVAIEYGVPGATQFLADILKARMDDFNRRHGTSATTIIVRTPDN